MFCVLDSKDPTKCQSVGDVEFSTAVDRAKWITPVPGGVGPLSIAMLFKNTINSAKWLVGLNSSECECSSSFSNALDLVSESWTG